MVTIGIIGLGHWGPNIARSLHSSGRARLKWLCDLRESRLETFQASYPEAVPTASMADVLGDSEVDAIAISTPATTHFKIAKAALEAGKHVLVEKPLTTSSTEAEELVRIAEQGGLTLMVGHVFEYNASVHFLRRMVESGELGKLHYLNFDRTNLGPVRTDVSALWDLAAHDISILCHVMGKSPCTVSATGAAYLNSGVEDVVFATYLFETGEVANVHASWLNPRKVRDITLVGSQKMLVFDDLDLKSPVKIYDKHVAVSVEEVADTFLGHKTRVVDGGLACPRFSLNEPLKAECEHFLDCIQNSSPCMTDGRSGARVVNIIEATQASMRAGGIHTRIAI